MRSLLKTDFQISRSAVSRSLFDGVGTGLLENGRRVMRIPHYRCIDVSDSFETSFDRIDSLLQVGTGSISQILRFAWLTAVAAFLNV